MEWSWKTLFNKLIKNMCYQIRYIQLRLRKAISVIQMKWHVLENQMWDSQTSILRVMLGPGHKLWQDKIIKISPEAKNFMARQYFNR